MARMKNGRIKAPPKRRNIEMVIISAQDLKDVRKLGKMRTFATVYCPTSQKVSTRVDSEGGTSPTWNEKIVLSIEESYLREENAQLTIDLYCRGTIRDKLVGTVRLFLANALKPGRGLNKFPATSHLVFRPTGDPQGILNVCIPPGGKFPDKIDLSFKDSESEMVDDIPPFQAPVEAGSSSGFEEDEDLAMEEDHFTPEKSPSPEKSPVSFHDLSPEEKSPVSDHRLSPQRSPVNFHELTPEKKSPVSDHRLSPQRSPVSAHDLSPEKKSPVSSHSPCPSRSDDEYLSLDDDHEENSPAKSQKKSPFRTPAGSPAKENDQNSPSKSPSELKNSPVKHFSPHREDAAIQKSPFRTPTRGPAKGNQDQTRSPVRNVAAAKEEEDLVQKSGSPDRKDDAVVEEMGIYKNPSPNRRKFSPHSSPDLTKKDERFKRSPPKGLSDSCAGKEDQLQSFESAARNQDQKLDLEDRNHYEIEEDHPPEKTEDQMLIFQDPNQDHLGNHRPAQKNEDQMPIHEDHNQDRLPENHLVEKNEDQEVIQLQKDHPVSEKEDQKQLLYEDFKFPVSRRPGREDLSKNIDPDVEKDRIEEQKIHEIQRSPMRSPPNPKSVRRNRGQHYPNYFA